MICVAAGPAFASDGNVVQGIRNNQEKDAKIEIYHCGERYCGQIVWLNEPNYPEGSQDGRSRNLQLFCAKFFAFPSFVIAI